LRIFLPDKLCDSLSSLALPTTLAPHCVRCSAGGASVQAAVIVISSRVAGRNLARMGEDFSLSLEMTKISGKLRGWRFYPVENREKFYALFA